MAIPTSRVSEKAEIRIDHNKCTGCGLCVSVCKDFSLQIKAKKLVISDNPVFGASDADTVWRFAPILQ